MRQKRFIGLHVKLHISAFLSILIDMALLNALNKTLLNKGFTICVVTLFAGYKKQYLQKLVEHGFDTYNFYASVFSDAIFADASCSFFFSTISCIALKTPILSSRKDVRLPSGPTIIMSSNLSPNKLKAR